MATAPLPDFDDSAELKTCLRDLIGLLGLPALWSSTGPERTLRLLAETLVELLSLDACAVTASFTTGQEPLSVVYAHGMPVSDAHRSDWLPFLDARSAERHQLSRGEELTPLGWLHVARFSLGYYGSDGEIVVASNRPDFPKPTELVLLRSAASLAASGLRTARMAYERERALRVKDEFLAMLGHELRNPLAPIVTALDLIKLKEGGRLLPEHMIIDRHVHHLKRLVDDLLDVTRIATGKIELQRQRLEIGAVVQAALEAAQPLISERRHQLACDVPGSGLAVNGDPLRLTQVVANLLINAAKYTEPHGSISVMARQAENQVVLSVQDNGNGIDRDLLPRVFELFEQGRMSIDRSRGGLGIGLSVVKSLVSLHGGSVRAESPGPGLGSTFMVMLPLAADAPASTARVDFLPEGTATGTERILIVDDNRDAVDVMGQLLEVFGHEVHVRYTPSDALLACDTLHPTVVIVDIGLPEMDGYELAQRIRARFSRDTPRLIAVTGYGQPQDRQRSADAGIQAHLTKPVRIESLLECIAGMAVDPV